MKYYDMHEQVYQDLRDQGYISWDKAKDPMALVHHSINQEIAKSVHEYFSHFSGKRALDLGTGTGTAALYLSQLGFDVIGYDVSETAITIAKENARNLGLGTRFEKRDLTTFKTRRKFDLIVDSSFLHCIVGDSERAKVLSKIRESLNLEGKFFIHTMVASTDMTKALESSYFFLQDDVLYSAGPESWEMEWQELDGRKVFPHRQIRSVGSLNKELKTNGFHLMDFQVRKNPGHPDVFIGWARANN